MATTRSTAGSGRRGEWRQRQRLLIAVAGDALNGGGGNDVYRVDSRAAFALTINTSRAVDSGQLDVIRLAAGIVARRHRFASTPPSSWLSSVEVMRISNSWRETRTERDRPHRVRRWQRVDHADVYAHLSPPPPPVRRTTGEVVPTSRWTRRTRHHHGNGGDDVLDGGAGTTPSSVSGTDRLAGGNRPRSHGRRRGNDTFLVDRESDSTPSFERRGQTP